MRWHLLAHSHHLVPTPLSILASRDYRYQSQSAKICDTHVSPLLTGKTDCLHSTICTALLSVYLRRMDVRRRKKTRTTAPSPSLLRRVKQEATNKYNDIRNKHFSNLTNYRWLRYVIALWTFRMVFVAIGFVFPLLSLLSSTRSEHISFELQSTKWTESNVTFLRNLISKEFPFLFHHAPVPECSIVGYLLLSYMSSTIHNVKKSEADRFIYYSSDQQWSSNISNSAEHQTVDMNKEDFMNQLKPNAQNQPNNSYLYVSQLLQNPESNPLLLSLAPYLIDLPSSSAKGFKPEFRLWLSSENVTAAPHYDMEHNFFLQLNGTKTFLIGSPTLSKLFQPHSNLHPHWRQAQQAHLTSVDAVYTHALKAHSCEADGNMSLAGIQKVIVSGSVTSLQWGPLCHDSFAITTQPHHSLLKKKKMKQKEKQKEKEKEKEEQKEEEEEEKGGSGGATAMSDQTKEVMGSHIPSLEGGGGPSAAVHQHAAPQDTHSGSLYEVTLSPGDMLYIPPYYYHAVTSHAHSVSLNSWLGSRYLVAVDALKNVDLPYRAQTPSLAQGSAVAAMVKMVWLNLNNPIGMEYFAGLMHERHSKTRFDQSCEVLLCSEECDSDSDSDSDSGKARDGTKDKDKDSTRSAADGGSCHCSTKGAEQECVADKKKDDQVVSACTLKSLKRAGKKAV